MSSSWSTSSTPTSTPDGSENGSEYTPSGSFLEESLIEHPPHSPSHDSAFSSISDNDSALSESEDGDAEAEWQESLQQLELLIGMVIVPLLGKWVGRRCAYWAWARFMTWKYPVEVVITDRKAFNTAGVVGSVASAPL